MEKQRTMHERVMLETLPLFVAPGIIDMRIFVMAHYAGAQDVKPAEDRQDEQDHPEDGLCIQDELIEQGIV
jgi:hypothetical protein